MKEHEAYPSKWLAASDLEEPVLAVIAGAEFAVVNNEKKVVVSFQGGKKPNGKFTVLKPMICNKTNFKEIKRILGQDDTEDWTGGEVVLTSQMVEFGGELVPGIRIRAPKERIRASGAHVVENKGKYDTLAKAAPVDDTADADAEEIPW